MFTQNVDAIYAPKNKFLWYLLAFQGGWVNVGGFLAVHRFVSHITGFAGRMAIELNENNLASSLSLMLVPIFFLMGSFTSAYFTDVKRKKGEMPVYIYVTLGMSLIYFLISILGTVGFLGVFGEPLKSARDYVLLITLVYACGIQNALFTRASGAIVRTTHLTGITTDLGIGLARTIFHEGDQAEHEKEKRANILRFNLILAFMLGSMLAVPFFSEKGFSGFTLPALLSLFLAFRLNRTRKKIGVSNLI